MNPSLVVLGSINTDMVVKAEHLPAPGETILGGSFLMNPGGKGANQAVSSKRLGGNVTFIAKTGNDIFGRQSVQLFQEEGISTNHMISDPVNPSGVALISVDKNGENCIVVASGANAALLPADLKNAINVISGASTLLMQLEIPVETVEYATSLAKSNGIRVILNPAPACPLPATLLEKISIITPNKKEAEMISGVTITDFESITKAAGIIRDRGVETVIITLGSEGAFICTDGLCELVPSPKVTAIDTTAAGDVFNGALAVALTENIYLKEAVVFACHAAALAVTKLGAQSSAPYKKEVYAFMKSQTDVNRVSMRIIKTIGLACFIFFQCHYINAQKLVLDGTWKYATKNDLKFSLPDLDDKDWKEKDAKSLSFTRAELDGGSRTTWLRKKVIFPSSLKKELEQTGALALFVGRIRQTDDFYFNGELVGKTTSSDIKRAYVIDPAKVNWDKENTIVFGIDHWGDLSGLETRAAPYIAAALPSNIFIFKTSADGVNKKQQVKNKQAIYSCIVTNHSVKSSDGMVKATFYDFSNNVVQTLEKNVTLAPGNTTTSFSFSSPSAFLKVRYTIDIPAYNYTATWNDEFGYNTVAYKPVDVVVADKVQSQFIPADVHQQVIKGWIGERMNANEEKRLINVDEEAILAGFINRPGSHPWIGEHAGKFLDAASNTYRNSGNAALKIQIDRTAQQLIAAQLEDGYIGTYTNENRWTSWDVWSHKYNIIGLLNYYSLSGFQPALEAAKKAGDLLCKTFGNIPGQSDIIKAGTHVGMASTSVLEPMVDLYRYTGDMKYLDFCNYIVKSYDQENGPKIITTLTATGRVDKTANAKAYEMLTNLVGLTKLYKVTGETRLLKPVTLAWNDIVKNRMYITGTASSFEHFRGDDDLPATEKDNMGEGCVTTTWMQLNYHLLTVSGELKYIDELERSVYNHLTGAENPQTGCVSYYTPLIGVKPYRCVITCCMSSVPRGISMIPLFTNGKINNQPSFLFYQPGTYSTTAANNSKASFTTVTNFPADGNITINVAAAKPSKYAVKFRKPYWSEDFQIFVNGSKQTVSNTDALTIDRTWKNGDKIAISFKMPLRALDGGKSYPGKVAFQRGPQVLALDKSLNNLNIDDVAVDVNSLQMQTVTTVLPKQWIGGEAFGLRALVNKTDTNIIMVPYADAGQTGAAITTWIDKK